jgi:DNA polymerase III subunit delta
VGVGQSKTFNAFVVLFGSEDFFLDRHMQRYTKSARQLVRLDGNDLTDVGLVQACEISGDSPRVVILDNAQELSGKKSIKEFVDNHDCNDEFLVLVIVYRGEKLPEIWRIAAEKGTKHEYRKHKPWDFEKKLPEFIAGEVKSLHVNLEKGADARLIALVGPDLYRLSNELRKLAIYVGQAQTIKIEHVNMVATRTPYSDPMRVADAAFEKSATKALANLAWLLFAMSESKTYIPVVNTLMRKTEQMLLIRTLQDKGETADNIAAMLELRPWVYKSSLEAVARKHSAKALVGYMGQLCHLDKYMKSDSTSKRTALELVLLSIAQ